MPSSTPSSPIIISSIVLSLFIPSAFPSSPLYYTTSRLLLCFPPRSSRILRLWQALSIFNMAASSGHVISLAVAWVFGPVMKVCCFFTDVKALVLSDLLHTAVTSMSWCEAPELYIEGSRDTEESGFTALVIFWDIFYFSLWMRIVAKQLKSLCSLAVV